MVSIRKSGYTRELRSKKGHKEEKKTGGISPQPILEAIGRFSFHFFRVSRGSDARHRTESNCGKEGDDEYVQKSLRWMTSKHSSRHSCSHMKRVLSLSRICTSTPLGLILACRTEYMHSLGSGKKKRTFKRVFSSHCGGLEAPLGKAERSASRAFLNG